MIKQERLEWDSGRSSTACFQMQSNFFKFLLLAMILIGTSSSSFARLVLYIDDPDTAGIDVLIVDNLELGDTVDPSLFGQATTTVADSDGEVGKIQGALSAINLILGNRGYELTNDVYAFSNFIEGPAPAGGNELQLTAFFEGVGITGGGAPTRLVIGASRSFVFNGQAWFMTHSGAGDYGGLASDTQIEVTGGIDGDANEFPNSGANYIPANFTADLVPETESYSFGFDTNATEDQDGNLPLLQLDISSAGSGLYTMYTRSSFQLDIGGRIGINNTIFATTPEPISIATWGLVGGGMWLTARRHRRRS